MKTWESRCAIVILNYNSPELTIESAGRLRDYSTNLPIVIVDNHSIDQSYQKIRENFEKDQYTYVIENEKNTGYAAGNNVGLRYVKKQLPEINVVCIMNPDIKVDSLEILHRLYVALCSDQNLAVITAQTIYNGNLRYPNDFGWKHLTPSYMMLGGTILGKIIKPSIRYTSLKVNENNIAYIDIVQGCFFMAKMNVLQEVGFFDEGTFLYEEEAILGKKIQRAGYKEAVLVDVFIAHNHHTKDKSLINKKNKLFDMKCFYNSRKHYIRYYSEVTEVEKKFMYAFLNLDYVIKKIIHCIGKKD